MHTSSHPYIVGYVSIFVVISLVLGSYASSEFLYNGKSGALSNQTVAVYNIGVNVGVIDPRKYSLRSFHRHDKFFKALHKKYNNMEGVQRISYREWLLVNNYGILQDTQESVFQRKRKSMITDHYKQRFLRTVMKGDILITHKKGTGFVGHVGLMATDEFALEMSGGKGYEYGIDDNNRRLSKAEWFDEYTFGYTTVYRCLNNALANRAADWAYRNYYNPNGDKEKTISTTYKITPDFISTDPSYSSKLVLQAFYYTDSNAISNVNRYGSLIIPVKMPDYFNPACQMLHVGRF